MVKLVPGQPLTTTVPVLAVDPGMAAGTYRIQLVVRDTDGEVSAPFVTLVRIIPIIASPPLTGTPPIGPIPIGPIPISPLPINPVPIIPVPPPPPAGP